MLRVPLSQLDQCALSELTLLLESAPAYAKFLSRSGLLEYLGLVSYGSGAARLSKPTMSHFWDGVAALLALFV